MKEFTQSRLSDFQPIKLHRLQLANCSNYAHLRVAMQTKLSGEAVREGSRATFIGMVRDALICRGTENQLDIFWGKSCIFIFLFHKDRSSLASLSSCSIKILPLLFGSHEISSWSTPTTRSLVVH